jgi:hypothetical protein
MLKAKSAEKGANRKLLMNTFDLTGSYEFEAQVKKLWAGDLLAFISIKVY